MGGVGERGNVIENVLSIRYTLETEKDYHKNRKRITTKTWNELPQKSEVKYIKNTE